MRSPTGFILSYYIHIKIKELFLYTYLSANIFLVEMGIKPLQQEHSVAQKEDDNVISITSM